MSKEDLIKEIQEMLDSNTRIVDKLEGDELIINDTESYMYAFFLYKLKELV